jgi:hypothetical protein
MGLREFALLLLAQAAEALAAVGSAWGSPFSGRKR